MRVWCMWLRLIHVFLFTSPISRFHARPVIPRNCVYLLSQHKKVRILTYRSPLSSESWEQNPVSPIPPPTRRISGELAPLKVPTRVPTTKLYKPTPFEWITSRVKTKIYQSIRLLLISFPILIKSRSKLFSFHNNQLVSIYIYATQ